MLKKLGIILSLMSLGAVATIPLTYADTFHCDATTTSVTGSIIEKGVNLFGTTPEVNVLRGDGISILLKLLNARELEGTDQVSFFTEQQAATGYVVFSKDGCAIALSTLPKDTIEKAVAFFAHARTVNAPQGN